jgi:hypothetical protein
MVQILHICFNKSEKNNTEIKESGRHLNNIFKILKIANNIYTRKTLKININKVKSNGI